MSTLYSDPARGIAMLIEAEDMPALDEELHIYPDDDVDEDA